MDDTRTAPELVAEALALARAAVETEDRGECGALLWQAAKDGAAAAPLGVELIASDDPVERAVGCELLGDASDQNEWLRDDTAGRLVALAGRETDVDVLNRLAAAIERTYDPRGVAVLVTLAGHPDAELREQVARSFPGLLTGRPDGPDIRALLTLCRDPEDEVRNWATFTLGFQAEVDSSAIRAALMERTTDPFPEVREEAVAGLARRHDLRAVPLLVELLADPEGTHSFTVSAATIMGVPELLPALAAYEREDSWLPEAMAACDPVRRAEADAVAWALVSELHRLSPALDAAVHMPRFDPGIVLTVGGGAEVLRYDVGSLLARADGDSRRAVELVASDAAGS